jgi:nucleoside-diphosphate-sugar epimerase
MQTILGAGGAIANELAKALTNYTGEIKLVSRNPKKINEGDLIFAADLLDHQQVDEAVKGSEVVYLTAGLPYNTKIWQKNWPVIINNVIDACIKHNCRLVFFDNIYLYNDKNLNPITESSPVNPTTKKGKLRAELVSLIWEAAEKKGLVALIARSADFYGPSIKNVSLLTETVFKPLSAGKSANWLVSDKSLHSFTYTIDAGNATAKLGNTIDAFGETWHLPTAKNPFTGKEWVENIAREMGKIPKYRTVSKMLIKFIGIFSLVMRESYEMLYQYDKDYVFNSDKFEKRFDIKPTPYIDGIRNVINTDCKK